MILLISADTEKIDLPDFKVGVNSIKHTAYTLSLAVGRGERERD